MPVRSAPILPSDLESAHTQGPTSAQKRIPELDGIRGVAIGMVLLIHLQQVLFPVELFHPGLAHTFGKAVDHLFHIGWMGVDIFFVLSGFLITGIIMRDAGEPAFYRGFYLRRATRILPVFLIVFLAVVFLIHRLPWPVYAAYLFFVANWLVLIPFEVNALGNLWSLAIEEQFYLFWPPIVRKLKKRTLLLVALSLAAGSILLRIVLTLRGVSVFTIYRMTFTRLDGLAMGAALAVSLDLPGPRRFLVRFWRRTSVIAVALWVLGFLSMKGSYSAASPRSLIVGSSTLEVLTCMVIFASLTGTLPPRLHAAFLNVPLRWLGRRSYALYLINSPVLAFVEFWLAHHHALSFLTASVALILVAASTLLLAELSWRLIESPAIRFGHRATHRSDQAAVRSLG